MKKYTPLFIGILVVLTPLLYVLFKNPKKAEAGWWDDKWRYKKDIRIHNSGTEQNDYQVKVNLDTSLPISDGKMKSDCSDIRLVDTNGLLINDRYYIEGCNSATTNIWIKFATLPTGYTKISLYYGNNNATTKASDGSEVFLFFDDFNDGTLDSTKWAVIGSVTETGGYLQVNTNGNSWNYGVRTINKLTRPFVVEVDAYGSGISGWVFPIFYKDSGSYVFSPDGWNNKYNLQVMTANNLGSHMYSSGTWVKTKLVFSPTSLEYHILGTGEPEKTVVDSALTEEYLYLGGGWVNSRYDNIKIRKYTSAEPTNTIANEETNPGPIAYWSFDEGYGTIANDNVNNLNGTLGIGSSAPAWQSPSMCVSNNCLLFDGTNDYVSVGNTVPGIKTISFWVKPATTTEYFIDLDNGSNYVSASSGTVSATGFISPTIYINGVPSTAIEANKWQHIAVTTETAETGTMVSLGRITNNFLQGHLDEVKIYSYARSGAQIKQDYLKSAAKAGSSAKLGDQVVGGYDLSNGLIGYYPFDEKISPAYDKSGNLLSGAWVGNTLYTAGKYGYCVGFDGTDDYINYGTSSSLAGKSRLTIAGWISMNSFTNTPAMFAETTSSDGDVRIGLFVATDGKPYLAWRDSSADPSGSMEILNADAALTTSTWYHLAAVYDSDSDIQEIYINGILNKSQNATVSALGTSATIGVTSGVVSPTLRTNDMNGYLDDLRIYDKRLTPKQILALYNWAPEPIGHWKMDENSGAFLYDSSGNANTGTLGSGNSAPSWSVGKFGSALNFDGTNDYTDLGSADILDNIPVKTVMFWTKLDAQVGTGGVGSHFLNKGDSGGGWFISTDPGNNRNIYGQHFGAGTAGRWSFPQFSTGVWHHIAVAYNRNAITNDPVIYVDGVRQTVTRYSSPTGSAGDDSANSVFVSKSPTSDRAVDGLIDDIKIYNYARTQDQIIIDMNAGHPAIGTPIGTPLLYFKFDEGTQNTCRGGTNDACDSSEHGYDGAIVGNTAPSWTLSGKFGRAMDFGNLTGQYLDLGDIDAFDFTTPFTISAWVYREGNCNAFGSCTIFAKGESANTGYGLLIENYGGSYKAYFSIKDKSDAAIGTTTINTNTWYHIVGMYDGTNIKVYVNGKLENENSLDVSLSSNNKTVTVGNRNDNKDLPMNGLIDELKVYNFALTDQQVNMEYNLGKATILGKSSIDSNSNPTTSSLAEYCPPEHSVACSAPIAEWKMDENTGIYSYDTSGNNLTGTLGTGTSSPSWAVGKISSGLDFDGNDIFNLDNYVSSIEGKNTGTISGWFRTSNTTPSILFSISDKNTVNDYVTLFLGASTASYNDESMGYVVNRGGAGNVYLRFYVRRGETFYQDGKWHHFAISLGGGDNAFYMDGVRQSVTYATGSSTTNEFTNINNQNTMRIGGRVLSSGQSFARVTLDNFVIFDYARSPAQIAWEYNKGKPIAHWKFDECQGTIVYDSSGKNNHGTITIGSSGGNSSEGTCSGTTGQAWYDGATGKSNASLDLDGTDDYIEIAHNDIFNITDSITVSAWVKTIDGTDNFLTTKKDDSWYLAIGPAGTTANRASFWLNGLTPSGWLQGTSNLDDGLWHHILGTYDKSAVKIYVDGKLENSTAKSGNISTGTANIQIGRRSTSYGGYSNGQIDEIKIFNYAMTAKQVQSEYNEGAVRFK